MTREQRIARIEARIRALDAQIAPLTGSRPSVLTRGAQGKLQRLRDRRSVWEKHLVRAETARP
jgi:hypothetical protein